MSKTMLIDASHPEETRVAILNKGRLEDFDFESSTKAQTKGNIYLAKVVRVEPSLQAAFVEYGGNRDGFLAFSEIHPDYYRIPVADREAMNQEAERAQRELAAQDAEKDSDDVPAVENETETAEAVDVIGGDDPEELTQARRKPAAKTYKIQDVIKRRQIMLVQVVKEERNAKGAALTTYLSLAGRYCVLMPNAEREGGVSRKITNNTDRKRLKSVIDGLEIPDNMGVIIRTAGMERSKAEIKRDYEYLVRCWNDIRDLTMQSTAPALIYKEGDLIKKAIRDLYSRDIEHIWVEGEEGYKAAKNFMRMLMPSHSKRIQHFRPSGLSLFQTHQVQERIDDIHNPVVTLRSGGYIVINPTEALVAIDVNSGRSTRERNIEETALKTNLEAAEEVALQLRLRDLAGLIVIDFIDMDDPRHNATVEKRLKESMAGDRARIQIGRISHFGLLELSRQRLRPSILEASSQVCRHCRGTGYVRSTESSALQVLRAIEEEGTKHPGAMITLRLPSAVAFYLLNHKRDDVIAKEVCHGIRVIFQGDDTLIPPDFVIERETIKVKKDKVERSVVVQTSSRRDDEATASMTSQDSHNENDVEESDETLESDGEQKKPEQAVSDASSPLRRRRRGRRGGRRRGRRPEQVDAAQDDAIRSSSSEQGKVVLREGDAASDVQTTVMAQTLQGHAEQSTDESAKSLEVQENQKRARRSGVRGRSRPKPETKKSPVDDVTQGVQSQESQVTKRVNSLARSEESIHNDPKTAHGTMAPANEVPEKQAAKSRRSKTAASSVAAIDVNDTAAEPVKTAAKPAKTSRAKISDLKDQKTTEVQEMMPQKAPSSPRKGWWQKLLD